MDSKEFTGESVKCDKCGEVTTDFFNSGICNYCYEFLRPNDADRKKDE